MSGLILKLRPNEELMINGVVVQNGDRKIRLRVKTNGAPILRLKDALHPDEATTPQCAGSEKSLDRRRRKSTPLKRKLGKLNGPQARSRLRSARRFRRLRLHV